MDPPPTAPPTAQPYSPEQAMYRPAYPPGQYPVVTQQPAPYAQQTTNTTVVVNQQPVVVQKAQRNWSTGLCGCFEDCGSLCRGIFCPFFLLTDVSSRMGEGCCFPCCCPGALLGLRIKLRVQENIQGTLFDDYCKVECCPLCVLCQLARELNHV
ncbi:placenta-specific gene 8 protein-like [Porites lutea]|uniref:placenta-specific gene 8 protein-like n=1 Tax=Porites lutea TaxID=51062 RepID=UPI003CC6D0E6